MQRLGLSEWLAAGHAIARHDLLRNTGRGQFCVRFETRLAKMTGVRRILTINSGTSALTCALAALGVGPGDEVLVPAYTWMSSAAAPLHVGAVPVLVDIDETLTMDPNDIERKITPHTRAILPVHMINRPCDMDRILDIARRHELLVVEDACQAVGVRYHDKYCGAIGDAGAFSFNQHKNLTIGEGGAVLLNDDKVYARAYNYHDIGVAFRKMNLPDTGGVFVGMNLRLNELQGAMLNAQLNRLPRRIEKMRRRYEVVHEALEKGGYPIAPHNDPSNGVGLAVTFKTEAEAIEFSKHRLAFRLYDNSKHVYTNWDAILEKRTFHPKMNPWAWAKREIEYSADMCERTLDILKRSCRVALGERYPVPVVRYLAQKFRTRGPRDEYRDPVLTSPRSTNKPARAA
jgi:dTDP-4-amino-4,6-dideoxygalactose transaminase